MDFVVHDNGVPQRLESISVEGVPLDLTLFVDTSPSFIGHLDRVQKDITAIASLLRPADRLRILALGHVIDEVVPWTQAGTSLNLDDLRIGRISSIYDGLAAAMLHQSGLDRRHLIVAMTDGADYNSAVSSARLLEISTRIEGVLHLCLMPSLMESARKLRADQARLRESDLLGQQRLRAAAAQTGGVTHSPPYGMDMVSIFTQVFEDFRTSYVLQYVPTGVTIPGWHEIKVEVPSHPRATVRARRGYAGIDR